jgi:predicted ester cyclase
MTVEERNKAGFRRVYEEGLNGGNLAVADELIDPEFLDREAHPGGNRGPESFRQLITMLRTAFPDLRFEIEDLIAEGDTVAGRLTMNGAHEGPLMGMPPTGRAVRQAHMHFVRFWDGKAVEHWGLRDDMGMMRQIRLMPEPGRSEETSSA